MTRGIATWGFAAALALTAVPAAAQSSKAKPKEVMMVGCVQTESEYRAALNAKKGGPLGSGAGQSNEFVLVKSTAAPKNGEAQTKSEAVATAGLQGDYLLGGKTEDELKRYIGRQVEVVGVVEPFRANKNAREDRDRLPKLMISSWHPVQDYCPAK